MSGSAKVGDGYLKYPSPRAIAHRGGAFAGGNSGIENSMEAFRHAVSLGYVDLETDVHVTRDGVVYASHDDHLGRLAEHDGVIGDLTAGELDALLMDGRQPFARLGDLLEAFPDASFSIDIKSDDALEPTCRLIESSGALDRVCLGSFEHTRVRRIRERLPQAVTAASRWEVALVKFVPLAILRRMTWSPDLLSVPHYRGGITVVTPRFMRRADALGLPVHVWIVDESDAMHHLLDLGVDGLFTDRTDILRDVLVARGEWRHA